MVQNYVMKVSTALSSKPIYIQIDDPTKITVGTTILKAVDSLASAGKPLEAEQLKQLYDTHQIFNNSRSVEKGASLNSLFSTEQQVGEQSIKVYEVDLITSHSGGN